LPWHAHLLDVGVEGLVHHHWHLVHLRLLHSRMLVLLLLILHHKVTIVERYVKLAWLWLWLSLLTHICIASMLIIAHSLLMHSHGMIYS
jgi:hypothetical protein